MKSAGREAIRRAFALFDRDGDGSITADELTTALQHPSTGRPFTGDEAQALIRRFDQNGDGVLDMEEFVRAFSSIAPHLDHSTAAQRDRDRPRPARLTGARLPARAPAACQATAAGSRSVGEQAIRRAFALFDRDGDGSITGDELAAALQHPSTGHPFTGDEAQALIRRFDQNGDGVLDMEEFVKAFSSIAPHLDHSTAAQKVRDLPRPARLTGARLPARAPAAGQATAAGSRSAGEQAIRRVDLDVGAVPVLDEAELRDWLAEHHTSTSEWGQETTKDVVDLLQELAHGDSTLVVEDGRAVRCLRVAKMRIQRPGASEYLIEAKQTLTNGKERYLGDMPGEKIFAHEAPETAALRGVRAELGDQLMSEPRLLGVLHETQEVKYSASYPGLRSRYTFYEVQIEIKGLPSEPFTTVEPKGEKGNATHHWEWRNALVVLNGDMDILSKDRAVTATRLRLLESLFSGCSRVVVSPMHGGLSGSLVLKTESFGADGQPQDPTVTKLDKESEMLREVKQTRYIHNLIGEGIIEIARGTHSLFKPIYLPSPSLQCMISFILAVGRACVSRWAWGVHHRDGRGMLGDARVFRQARGCRAHQHPETAHHPALC